MTARPVPADANEAPPTLDAAELRRQALARLHGRRHDASKLNPAETAALVHELEIHQVELEVQNEELRRAQQELLAARDRYADLYELAPVGYLTLDDKSVVTQANLWACQLLGIERSKLVGRPFQKLLSPADADACYLLLRAAAANERHESAELRIVRKGRPEVWVAAEMLASPRSADAPARFRMTLTEITGRKYAEEALRQANDQLEQKVQARTAELATRANQLRALAGELTLSEQRERRRMARILHDHVQQLLVGAKFRATILGRHGDQVVQQASTEIGQLIDDCISASRSLTAELSPPILHDGGLVPGLEWLARWMADKHGLIVSLSAETDLPPLAEDIRILLFESVRELLFNAVKHARAGSATVNVRVVEGGQLRITVSDTGAGFDPTAMKKVGERGAGFGLFSIRERLDLVGGKMTIDAVPGQGSRFMLTMPLTRDALAGSAAATASPPEAPGKPAPQVRSPKPGVRIRVMLADDHVVMREGLAQLLGQEADIEVIGQAVDGQEAIELAARLQPDVILMDMSMPRLNGVEATRAIHNDYPHIRIIGLSMFSEKERAQALRDAGAVAYLTKSGPPDELIAAIRLAVEAAPD